MDRSGKSIQSWHIVAAGFIIVALLDGLSQSVFQSSIEHLESLEWTSRSQKSVAFATLSGIAVLCTLFALPLIGIIVDRKGARKTLLAGCLLSAVGMFLFSTAKSQWQFSVFFGIVYFAVALATAIPVIVLVMRWFERRRGLALGIVLTAHPFSTEILQPVIRASLGLVGWRMASFAHGLLVLLVTVPAILFMIREHPPRPDMSPDGSNSDEYAPGVDAGHSFGEAFRSPAFWLVVAALSLTGFGWPGVSGTHSRIIGHSGSAGAMAISLGQRLALIGPVVFGLMADRWSARKAFAIGAGLISLWILLLAAAWQSWMISSLMSMHWILLIGPGFLIPLIVADCHGLARFGTIYGVLTLLGTGGMSIAMGITTILVMGVDMSTTVYRLALCLLIIPTLLSAYCILKARTMKRGTH